MKLFLIVLALLLLLFLPWKKEGEWRNMQTGTIAVGSQRNFLNRWYFGYIPEYHWFGYRPTLYKEEGVSRNYYQIISKTLVIDWGFFLFELLLYCFLVFGYRVLNSQNSYQFPEK